MVLLDTRQSTKREYFFRLLNLGQYPEYFPTALEITFDFLNQKVFKPSFRYNSSNLLNWLQEEYEKGLANMRQGHWIDTGILADGREVGRFSDQALQERLRQYAPNNFVDGAWLDRIMPCGSATWVEGILFQIRYEEGGGGKIEENHPNLYGKLLKSQGIDLPVVYSREFSEESKFLDVAFDQPVFQLAISLFPRQFLPELIGMTIWFEWNSTPAAFQAAKCLRRRGFDPTYYQIHQRIDNPHNGHGFLARRAVEIYLGDIEQKGEDVQANWQRIWQGYHVWDTLSETFERDLQNYLVIFDGKV